ncbi:4'-phosphopantetheinyl transferase [Clostridium cavendishii DSM 21758]|uniref:4'-phosphopantetheinyl transferase n=1 Tax=Clostridium cavendishii DSM 21758 TaxID=1121302 RepID=A0A1M6KVM8_9CLOT|nr:4'-phosphopantetheinyl transferase superfamily protein [Clostridium cavendishii]SHJ62966.1 4'-phosphopantetheinyl transferase [Clostridium cavendishii DSM 21758]
MNIYAVEIVDESHNQYFYNLIRYISKEKYKKVENFKFIEDKLRAIYGELLIRNSIIEECKLDNSNLSFQYSKYGKPYVKNINNFHFNISHSGKWVVCATDKREIGIDIEEVKPIDVNIAKKIFCEEEYMEILKNDVKDRVAKFYDYWTLKESFIKNIGEGLSFPLNSFYIRECNYGMYTTFLEKNNKQYFFKKYKLDYNYKMSVCSSCQYFIDEIKVYDVIQIVNNIKRSIMYN